MRVTATFHAPDWDDSDIESCFTVSVRESVSKEERDDLINAGHGKAARLTRNERNGGFNRGGRLRWK